MNTSFYEDRIKRCSSERDSLKKTIYSYGTIRLLLVVAAIIALWLLRHSGWMAMGGVAFVFAVPFAVLMALHNRLAFRLDYVNEALRLNSDELQGLNNDFSAFDGAPELTDLQHEFAADLDLFGRQSLFQSLNRTVMPKGKKCLAEWFLRPLSDKPEILHRQEAVRELSQKTGFRQHFQVMGRLHRSADIDILGINGLSSFFTRSILWRILAVAIPVIWVASIAGFACMNLPFSVLVWVSVVSFPVAYLPGKRVTAMYRILEKAESTLKTYSSLIQIIENEKFTSGMLRTLQNRFEVKQMQASQAIRKLSKIIGALDQRFSLGGIICNILYLRDVRQAMRLERWVESFGGNTAGWMDALVSMDAYCSLGGFAFNHPDYVYPGIVDEYFRFDVKEMGHPLIPRDKCVKNDLSLTKHPDFVIITGANMAGKSTYLRTAGVNFVLACVGLPVCAASLTVYPAKLFTSLRTTDSLASGESYFLAELKRLKTLIDRLQSGEQMFIILDEVLKGTNSVDKQKGSLALMRQLVTFGACGMIATHDLMLGNLAREFPDDIRNCCFEADIDGDRLTFSYKLREGVAKNMNASYLMKRMGITV
jgi:predicted ATPase